jgi:hypothetical protein
MLHAEVDISNGVKHTKVTKKKHQMKKKKQPLETRVFGLTNSFSLFLCCS